MFHRKGAKSAEKDMDEYEDCPHDKGTYHDKNDFHHPDIERCNLCDEVMNYSKKEYEGDLYDDEFWGDEDDDW